jgi:predicted DsbA family dithiol-disulfide isomerase
MTIEALFGGRSAEVDQMKARWVDVARRLGLPFVEQNMVYNTRLAQELGKWAESQDKGDAFHDAVFRGYFAEGKDIGDIRELLDLATSVGLAGEEAGQALETRAFREAVDYDWSRCREMGVRSVPTFVVRHQGVVGAQPYDVLQRLMWMGSVKKRRP